MVGCELGKRGTLWTEVLMLFLLSLLACAKEPDVAEIPACSEGWACLCEMCPDVAYHSVDCDDPPRKAEDDPVPPLEFAAEMCFILGPLDFAS